MGYAGGMEIFLSAFMRLFTIGKMLIFVLIMFVLLFINSYLHTRIYYLAKQMLQSNENSFTTQMALLLQEVAYHPVVSAIIIVIALLAIAFVFTVIMEYRQRINQ